MSPLVRSLSSRQRALGLSGTAASDGLDGAGISVPAKTMAGQPARPVVTAPGQVDARPA